MLPICEVDPRAGGWRRDPDVGIHHGWMGSVQAPWPSRLPSDRDLRPAHEEHRMVDVLTADRPERVATRIATHPTSGRGRSGPASRVGADLGGPYRHDPWTQVRAFVALRHAHSGAAGFRDVTDERLPTGACRTCTGGSPHHRQARGDDASVVVDGAPTYGEGVRASTSDFRVRSWMPVVSRERNEPSS